MEAEIPFNTGNIGRTCVATNSSLHLIRPLGFKIDSKLIKKAGLDYWDRLDLHIYDDFDDFIKKNNNPIIYMATTKAKKRYDEVEYEPNSYIMFGKESGGIPEEILVDYKDFAIRIPMESSSRSLNLSNSASIVLYEALRQGDFQGLETKGDLHNLKWT